MLNNIKKLNLKDFHEEHAVQAFRSFDSKKIGHILPSNFKTILVQLKSHLLSPFVKENLENVIELAIFEK
jgi:solute carrier family 25 aspartate/glutamate transporter 12/13